MLEAALQAWFASWSRRQILKSTVLHLYKLGTFSFRSKVILWCKYTRAATLSHIKGQFIPTVDPHGRARESIQGYFPRKASQLPIICNLVKPKPDLRFFLYLIALNGFFLHEVVQFLPEPRSPTSCREQSFHLTACCMRSCLWTCSLILSPDIPLFCKGHFPCIVYDFTGFYHYCYYCLFGLKSQNHTVFTQQELSMHFITHCPTWCSSVAEDVILQIMFKLCGQISSDRKSSTSPNFPTEFTLVLIILWK